MFVLIRRRLASRNAVYIYTGTDQCHVIPESRDTVTWCWSLSNRQTKRRQTQFILSLSLIMLHKTILL